MDSKNQNQNNKPGFEFILEQQGPKPRKKGMNKKLLVIGILLFITLISIGILLFTASNNVQRGDTTISEIDIKTKRVVTRKFLQDIRLNNIDGAIKNFSTSSKITTSKLRTQTDDFWSKILLDTCKEFSDDKIDKSSIQYRCLHKSGDTIMIRFKITNEAGTFRINTYNVWVYSGESL